MKYRALPSGESWAAKFAAKVRVGEPNECWLWQGHKDTHGYGQIRLAGRDFLAHRLAWSLARGPIPPGQCVLHRCDVPACVNPDHLFLGTQRENIADMVAKGRHVALPGERNGRAKLVARQVREIRADDRTQREVAADYGITSVMVGKIKRRESWRHIEG